MATATSFQMTLLCLHLVAPKLNPTTAQGELVIAYQSRQYALGNPELRAG